MVKVINHGVSGKLMEDMIKATQGFFHLTEEEKREYVGEDLFSPITNGKSWRDYLRAFVHPDFHFPNKPPGLRDIAQEYSKGAREVATELFKRISESLGLEENYIHKQMDLDEGIQIMSVNHYPPCPQPASAMGLPPHSDHSFVSLLIQNGIDGLEILHKEKWVPVYPPINSFVVNVGDHLEVLTNGKYKSLLHRSIVNNNSTRMSIVIGHGPKLDTIVGPAPELVDAQNNPPAYRPTKYREYYELQQKNKLLWPQRTFFDHVRL